MLGLNEDYIFEFVSKTFPQAFMAVPKPAEIPGFLKKGIIGMKHNFLTSSASKIAIDDGRTSNGHSAPIVEEPNDSDVASTSGTHQEDQLNGSISSLAEHELDKQNNWKEVEVQNENSPPIFGVSFPIRKVRNCEKTSS